MKTKILIIAFTIINLFYANANSQSKQSPDSLGLPGDNLNLYAVLDLFQKSETVESFEKSLNEADWKINNLDLNGDDKIDYISVKDNVTGTSHAIVLQTAINEKETQDIAVIEVEKTNDDNVNVQIIGDEELYGKNYIVEPKEVSTEPTEPQTSEINENKKDSDNSKNKTDNEGNTYITNNYYNSDNNYVPVKHWHIIHYIYVPTYVVYVSPWHFGYFPGWWTPWAPLYWHQYYGFHRHYFHHPFYHRGWTCRTPVAHGYYHQHRVTSVIVAQRRQRGDFKSTYSHPELKQKGMNEHKQQRQNDHRQRNAQHEPRNNGQNKNGNEMRKENGEHPRKNKEQHTPRKENNGAKSEGPKHNGKQGGQHQQAKQNNKGSGGRKK